MEVAIHNTYPLTSHRSDDSLPPACKKIKGRVLKVCTAGSAGTWCEECLVDGGGMAVAFSCVDHFITIERLLDNITQFAISGECESFGSNNLMGLWLKAIGGYTVEEIGMFCCSQMQSQLTGKGRRLLSFGRHCCRDCLDPCMCNMDRFDTITGAVACACMDGHSRDCCEHLHRRVE